MSKPNLNIHAIGIISIALLFSGCANINNIAKAPTGCCKVTSNSCDSPVTEKQCEEQNGISFHEGGTCRSIPGGGVCGVLQE